MSVPSLCFNWFPGSCPGTSRLAGSSLPMWGKSPTHSAFLGRSLGTSEIGAKLVGTSVKRLHDFKLLQFLAEIGRALG